MGFDIKIEDHSEEVLRAFLKEKAATLEAVGQAIEREAKLNIERNSPEPLVDTGRLKNSITHTTATHEGVTRRYTTKNGDVVADHSQTVSINDPDAVVVGTNVSYGVYHEIGTGIYASEPGGRQTPWKFMGKDGKYHWTRGVKAKHFLKNAIKIDKIKLLIKSRMGSGK